MSGALRSLAQCTSTLVVNILLVYPGKRSAWQRRLGEERLEHSDWRAHLNTTFAKTSIVSARGIMLNLAVVYLGVGLLCAVLLLWPLRAIRAETPVVLTCLAIAIAAWPVIALVLAVLAIASVLATLGAERD